MADKTGLNPAARRDMYAALAILDREGIKYTLTSAYRDSKKQAALYANRASNPNPVAPPGSSNHEKGLAIDLDIHGDPERGRVILAAHGWGWHGPDDPVHFDYRGAEKPSALAGVASPSALKGIAPPSIEKPSALSGIPAPAALKGVSSPAAEKPRAAKPTTAGQAKVGDLMGDLLKGKHLAGGQPPPPARPTAKPSANPIADLGTWLWQQTLGGALETAGDLGNATTAATNAYARSVRTQGPDFPTQAQAAARAALGSLRGAAPERPAVASELLGVTPQTHPVVRYPATAADFLISLRTDPLNKLADPLLRDVGADIVGLGKQGVAALKQGAGTVRGAVQAEKAATAAPAAVERLRAQVTRALEKSAKLETEAGRLLDQGNATAATKRYEQAARRQQQASALAGVIPPTQAAAAARPTGATGALARGRVGAENVAVNVLDDAFGKGAAAGVKRMAGRAMAWAGAGPDAKRTAEEVKRGIDTAGAIGRFFRNSAGTTKGMLVGNPATSASNTVGGYLMSKLALDTAGVNGDRLHATLGAALREAAEARKGQISADIAALGRYSNAFKETIAGLAREPGATGKVQKVVGAATQPFLTAQDFSDKVFKLGTYKALRQAGKSPQEAARLVDLHLFDYSDRSALVEFVDRYGIAPFSTFGAKANRAFVEGIATRPDLMRRFLMAREKAFADPKDRAAYEKLPDHEKGLFTLPLGDGKFLNLNRYNPFGGSLNTVQAAANVVRTGKLPEGFLLDQAGRPLPVKGAVNIVGNRRLIGDDPNRLPPVSQPGEPLGPTVLTRGRQLLADYAPSLLGGRGTQGLLEGMQGQAPTDAKGGKARPLSEIALQYGLGLRAADTRTPDEREKANAGQIARRRQVAGVFVRSVRAQAAKAPGQNPYRDDVAGLSREEARRRMNEAKRALDRLLTSGRAVNDRGELTPEGRYRLRTTAQYLDALVARSRAK